MELTLKINLDETEEQKALAPILAFVQSRIAAALPGAQAELLSAIVPKLTEIGQEIEAGLSEKVVAAVKAAIPAIAGEILAQAGTKLVGDLNADGSVNAVDLTILLGNYGATSESKESSA